MDYEIYEGRNLRRTSYPNCGLKFWDDAAKGHYNSDDLVIAPDAKTATMIRDSILKERGIDNFRQPLPDFREIKLKILEELYAPHELGINKIGILRFVSDIIKFDDVPLYDYIGL